MTQLRYSIEKENVDFSRKINILSYFAFTKALETYKEDQDKATLILSNGDSINQVFLHFSSFII